MFKIKFKYKKPHTVNSPGWWEEFPNIATAKQAVLDHLTEALESGTLIIPDQIIEQDEAGNHVRYYVPDWIVSFMPDDTRS